MPLFCPVYSCFHHSEPPSRCCNNLFWLPQAWWKSCQMTYFQNYIYLDFLGRWNGVGVQGCKPVIFWRWSKVRQIFFRFFWLILRNFWREKRLSSLFFDQSPISCLNLRSKCPNVVFISCPCSTEKPYFGVFCPEDWLESQNANVHCKERQKTCLRHVVEYKLTLTSTL